MRYRSSARLRRQNFLRHVRQGLLFAVVAVALGGGAWLLLKDRQLFASANGETAKNDRQSCETHVRISRSQIPKLNLRTLNYAQAFDDLNEVQLAAAEANGLKDPARWGDMPEKCADLRPIYSTELYYVDTMTHSKPFLRPDAALLLHYIGLRFRELQQELHYDDHCYLPIVTSALRSQNDVQRLRRRNRNSSENSCHIYGTTMDISYIRFLREDGEVVNEEWLKQLLSTVLYELRYEGLCYVKYERRQACFHLTERSVDYRGRLASESLCYQQLPFEEHSMVVRDDDGNVLEVRAPGAANAALHLSQQASLTAQPTAKAKDEPTPAAAPAAKPTPKPAATPKATTAPKPATALATAKAKTKKDGKYVSPYVAF